VGKLLEHAEIDGTEIRVIAQPHSRRNTPFSIYKPGGSETAPPTFVYSEVLHGSCFIQEDGLIAEYHEAGQAMWILGIPLKEFLHEHCRDLLA